MKKIWDYVREKALTLPAHYAVTRMKDAGRTTDEVCVLSLIKYQDQLIDSLQAQLISMTISGSVPIYIANSNKNK